MAASEFILTPKRSKFVTEYLVCRDAQKAAKRAKYPPGVVKNAEKLLLKQTAIRHAIKQADDKEENFDLDEFDDFYLDSGLTPDLAKMAIEAGSCYNLKVAAERIGIAEDQSADFARQAVENPLFVKAVKLHKDAQIRRLSLTKDRVLGEIMKLAFFNIRELFDENGNLKSIKDIDEDISAAVSEITVNELFDSDGLIGHTKKIKAADKQKALKMLGDYLKMFETDNTGKIVDDKDISDVELMAKAVAFAQAAARGIDDEWSS